MSVEKFINGKKDESKHEGKRAEVRRLQETDQQLKDYRFGHDFYSEPVITSPRIPSLDMLAKKP